MADIPTIKKRYIRCSSTYINNRHSKLDKGCGGGRDLQIEEEQNSPGDNQCCRVSDTPPESDSRSRANGLVASLPVTCRIDAKGTCPPTADCTNAGVWSWEPASALMMRTDRSAQAFSNPALTDFTTFSTVDP